MRLVDRAREFATTAHAGQTRKYTGDPYVVHPIAVASIVEEYTQDPTILAAALLHDVIEDTPTTAEDIARVFGTDVAALVVGLTDVSRPTDGNRAQRKALDREHLAGGCAAVHLIKVADLIDNTVSIVQHAPDFAPVYLAEKRALLGVLTKAPPALLAWAWATVGEVPAADPVNFQFLPPGKIRAELAARFSDFSDVEKAALARLRAVLKAPPEDQ